MKRLGLSVLLLLIGCFSACTPDKDTLVTSLRVDITGNTAVAYRSSDNQSPVASRAESEIGAGTTISFFSKGGIVCQGEVLSYGDNRWNGLLTDQWQPGGQPATVTAFAPPVFEDDQPIYLPDGNLRDILFVKQTYPWGKNITLDFNHLFSQLSFRVDPSLNRQLSNICFTPSVRIKHIDTETARIECDNTQSAPKVCLTQQADGVYTLFVAPVEAVSVDIEIMTSSGKTFRTQLSESNFTAGVCYQCNILYDDGTAGIHTAEDFIAFTHLINGKSYGDRSLDEFGITNGGIVTYRLKNDIVFTEEESSQLLPIGMFASNTLKTPFSDIFDGDGYTLYNITLPVSSANTGCNGLFAYIGKSGEVKNLYLENINCEITNKGTHNGLLSGVSEGIIDNCHIRGGKIRAKSSDITAAGLVGSCRGVIRNSSVENYTLGTALKYAAGFAYINQGKIQNCYIANSAYMKTTEGGEMTYQCYNGEMSNCYVYGGNDKFYSLANIAENSLFSHCYYPKDSYKNSVSSQKNNVKDFVKYYETETIPTLLRMLNEWTDSVNALSSQPQFLNWGRENNPPITLIIKKK